MATSNDGTAVDIQAKSHPAQERFIRDTNAETAYIGGVGSGKTAGGVLRVARHIAEWNPGVMGVVVAPTVPMMNNAILPEFRKWGLLDRPGITHNRTRNRIEYPNGSVAILETANNDKKIERLRAMNLAWAWIDEAAYLPAKVYNILSDRLRVGQYRNLFATTTPRGFNWVYDTFADIDADPEPIGDGQLLVTDTTTTITGTSTRSNPAHPEDYIERQERQRTGEAYQQEIEGEFVNFEGLVYQWFDRDDHVTTTEDLPESFDRFMYGADWGFHPHPAAMYAIGVRDGEYWYLAEHYETRNTVADLADVLVGPEEGSGGGWYDQFAPGPVYCDPSEPSNIEQFNRRGIRAKKADNAVEPGIQHVTSLADDIHVHESCQAMINEFNQYQYADGGDEPLKENDHAMDGGLRYPLFTDETAIEGGGTVIEW